MVAIGNRLAGESRVGSSLMVVARRTAAVSLRLVLERESGQLHSLHLSSSLE